MTAQSTRPEAHRAQTAPVPGLTHAPSLESIGSPITPSNDVASNPLEKNLKINTDAPLVVGDKLTDSPAAGSPKLPSKDLAFLAKDPYADDDVIPFDKNKAIIPSRSGSVRSIMSTNSIKSIKRGLGSLKRKLSRRKTERPRRTIPRAPTVLGYAEDGITPILRTESTMMAPSFSQPRRVETFQVCAMAF